MGEIKKERFAKFYVKTWADRRVYALDPFEERFFINSFTNMNSIRAITGIYEVNRGTMCSFFGFTSERILMLEKYGIAFRSKNDNDNHMLADKILNQIITRFNCERELRALLEYNIPEHIMFVKNYFKFQFKTIGNPVVAIKMILNDFDESFKKVPHFWQEFSKINERDIKDLRVKLLSLINAAELALLKLLEDSKSKPNKVEDKRKSLKEYQNLISKYDIFLEKLSLT